MSPHALAAGTAALFLASSAFGHAVSVRLLLLAAGIVLAALAVARDKSLRTLPALWPFFALWGAWALLSLAWSIEPGRTLKEWRNEVFYTGAALWICYVAAQARGATRIFPAVLGLAAFAACGIALYTFSLGWERYNQGWHGGPGDHSSALLTLMPLAAMGAWLGSRGGRRPWLIAAGLALVALFLASAYTTLNRTVWLGFAAQFLLMGCLLLLRGRFAAPARMLALGLAVAAAAGCAAVLYSIQSDRLALGVARPIGQDSRMQLWPQVAAHVAERPLTGYGFGRGLLREPLQDKFKDYDPHLWHAHNLFLEAMVQLGAPGLVLLVLLLAALVGEGWRRARDPDDRAAAAGMALLGVVAGMVVRNMTDTLLVRQNALLFWGTVGVLLAWGMKTWRPASA